MRVNILNRLAATFITALLLSSSNFVYANHAVNQKKGVMLEGYDVVAYHTMGKAKRGSERFHADWLGGTWHFTSQGHRDLFIENPEKYLPQYGGYCALSYANGKEHGGVDPKAFQIIEGKLYLFYGMRQSSRWDLEQPYIQEAEKKWDKAKAGLVLE